MTDPRSRLGEHRQAACQWANASLGRHGDERCAAELTLRELVADHGATMEASSQHVLRIHTVEQIRGFLDGNGEVDFRPLDRDEAHDLVRRTLLRLDYDALDRAGKGTVREYLVKATGLSRAQVTRLIGQYRETGRIEDRRRGNSGRPFAQRLHAGGHPTAGGGRRDRRPALRSRGVRGDAPRVRGVRQRALRAPVAAVPVPPVHAAVEDLPRAAHDRRAHPADHGTHRAPASGSTRQARLPARGHSARVDFVHVGRPQRRQGRLRQQPGRPRPLAVGGHPVRARRRRGRHRRIRSWFPYWRRCSPPCRSSSPASTRTTVPSTSTTQSPRCSTRCMSLISRGRARHSNDSALVEGKNASVVRKWLGHDHIPQRFAPQVNAFANDVLSPYLNHHHPCLFATEVRDAKRKVRRRYRRRDVATPYEKLKSLPDAARLLKPGVTFASRSPTRRPTSRRTAARTAPGTNCSAPSAGPFTPPRERTRAVRTRTPWASPRTPALARRQGSVVLGDVGPGQRRGSGRRRARMAAALDPPPTLGVGASRPGSPAFLEPGASARPRTYGPGNTTSEPATELNARASPFRLTISLENAEAVPNVVPPPQRGVPTWASPSSSGRVFSAEIDAGYVGRHETSTAASARSSS